MDNYSSCTSGLNLALTLYDPHGNQLLHDDSGACSGINYYVESNAQGLWPGDPDSAPYSADGGIFPRDGGP